ncbi:MAG: diaminopimelate decarboxylase [Planctomycetaceae bacterium]|nr:diaminopimelate decarboxylase [Planctomycetaceae bacterium]
MKTLPFDRAFLEELTRIYPTPFHIYDEKAIRRRIRRIREVFTWNEGFQPYFAVKAAPNPYLLKIAAEEGMGTDCSSLAELVLSEKAGLRGEKIMFTSNNTPASEYAAAKKLDAIINLDDISHIDFLERTLGQLPERISIRYNPGPLRQIIGQAGGIIGNPEDAKYGFTREQTMEGYKILKDRGVKRFGLHTMVASNQLEERCFVDTAWMLFDLVLDLYEKHGVQMEMVNLGGGVGIPYRPEDKPFDFDMMGQAIQDVYEEMIRPTVLHPLKICTEYGRCVTGPFGCLVTRAIHRKNIYKKYVGVDSCMANLMRPALYGAYHHITVAGKEENAEPREVVDVVGSLCENNDKFAIDRELPVIEIGDLLVIHDTGAHGHAMGFQYNGKLRSAELLLCEDGTVKQIRRAETLDDYFATLDFSDL